MKIHGVMETGNYERTIGMIVPHQQEMIRVALGFLPRNAKNILELGCGTGILTERILIACPGAGITGLDISEDMLDVAGKKPGLAGVRFITRDIRKSWPDTGYDVIITSLCLHHLSGKERIRVAHRAARALNPGGLFICGDIFRAEHDWEEDLLMESWKRAMREAGAGDDVIAGMVAQRTRRLSKLSTISWFRERLAEAGFSSVFVPFVVGFLGLVIGYAPVSRRQDRVERRKGTGARCR
ncbi:MAG: hypothetical protein A4E35_01070 [Methanoregula sp. PtaU1.Bin051]|nr:MAG: hypothetical protein A4E35_01070 [Methanoregula sp. PtaU1.Bin051]